MIRTRKKSRSSGLTLVELLVVLTILAILTTVAVVSTETVLQQGRFEATQRTLQAIEEAVLGPGVYRSEDGTLTTSGFVADMGRLPTELSELWQHPADLPGFDFFPAEDDPDVSLPYGWRGPYLRLPAGAEELLDGWGNPFEWTVEFDALGQPAAAMVRSFGADGRADSAPDNPYARELGVVFLSEIQPFDGYRTSLYRTSIQVSVWQRDEHGSLQPAGEDVEVALYTRGMGEIVEHPWVVPQTTASPPRFRFDFVPIGMHALRAYGEHADSSVLPIQVHPMGTTTWQLVLPYIDTTVDDAEESPEDNDD